jgi:hypothetical protein
MDPNTMRNEGEALDAKNEAGAGEEGKGKPAGEQPPPETKKDAGKPEEPKPLELKFEEGLKLDEQFLGSYKDAAGKLKLSQEQAQGIANAYASHVKAQNAADAKAFEETKAGWSKAIAADPELGGAKAEATKKDLARGIAILGGEEVAKLLKATGLEGHPAVVRAFARAGRAIREDSISGTGSGPKSSAEAALAARYPTMK